MIECVGWGKWQALFLKGGEIINLKEWSVDFHGGHFHVSIYIVYMYPCAWAQMTVFLDFLEGGG